MQARTLAALIFLALVTAAAGCRAPSSLYNDYDVLYFPPPVVTPQAGAPDHVPGLLAETTVRYVLKLQVFPKAVTRAEEIPEGAKVLRLDGTITRFRQPGAESRRGIKGLGGEILDARFVDPKTERIVGQSAIRGKVGEGVVEEGDPAVGRLTGAIVRYLWYSKSNKPRDL